MRRTHVILSTFAAMTILLAASFAPVAAVNASWGVSSGTWTWKVTKCAWDQYDTTTTWIGRSATINVTGAGNSSTHAWITGDVSLKEANGTEADSFTGIVLGNVSTDGSELLAYANPGEFILPAIIPLPMDKALTAFTAFLNDTIHDLIASVPSGFPVVVHDDMVFTTTTNTLMVNFTVDVDYQGTTLDGQEMILAITFDANGVATRFEAYVANISTTIGGVPVTVAKFLLFEITRTDQLPGLDVPGFPTLVLLLVVPAAIAFLALRARRQHA